MELGSAQLMKLFWCSFFSCSELDNQKQSRIGNLLQVLQWMLACTVEILDAKCLASYLYLFCLSNMKNLGRNFPCLVSAHSRVSSFICSKFHLIYHGRLPGPLEGNKKKTNTKKTQKQQQQKIINSLHFEKWLVPDWKIPMRWSFYLAQTEYLSILLSTCQFGKTTSLSHTSHIKRFQRDQLLRYQETFLLQSDIALTHGLYC